MLTFSKPVLLKSGASVAVLSLLMGGAASAHGLPSNGHFVSGQGQIGKAGQSLTVKQSSTTGIINWNSFSVGKHQGVTFDNGSGATLNRVTGGNLSTIAGSLHATGSLYLMNSSGVIVGGTGHVVTGGSFVASSGNIAGDAFSSHRMRFNTGNGIVINRGSITSGGNAILNGRGAANTGSISASSVRLQATTGNVLDSGTITASGSAHHGAAHILLISQSGKTRITGDLTAHGKNGAGSIETSGHSVSIGGHIDAGKGGSWLIDPEDLVVDSTAATTIDNSLNAGTDVTLKTTATGTSGTGTVKSGPGDIEVMAPLSWSTSATLTLDAYHSVHFNDLVSITGAGGLDIVTNDGGTGGALRFLGGSVDYGATDNGGTLTINGDSYTLVYDMTDIQAINHHLHANYALATSLDATSVSDWVPIGTDGSQTPLNGGDGFVGNFEGLGHTISNLVVTSGYYEGLFGYASDGTISDLGMIGGSVAGGVYAGPIAGVADNIFNAYSNETVSGQFAGGLAGEAVNVSNSYATGAVSGSRDVGGLVGALGLLGNAGTEDVAPGIVTNSYATGDISGDRGDVGGLIGYSTAGSTMQNIYATGSVTNSSGGANGGLVGVAQGNIVNAYAEGNVSGGTAGGLAGSWSGTNLSHSYATGTVTGLVAGGLVGGVSSGPTAATMNRDYATGQVTVSTSSGAAGGLIGGAGSAGNDLRLTIENSHATGTVTGNFSEVGGLVGNIGGVFTISNSYATGRVSGSTTDGEFVGGLVGAAFGYSESEIVDSYATGNVSGGENVGGLIGNAERMNIENSFATGSVRAGKNYAGGLVGSGTYLQIDNSYATGSIKGQSYVGGLLGAGIADKTGHKGGVYISDSYATGTVRAQGDFVGGLIGIDTDKFKNEFQVITDSYATGRVYGDDDVGGFAGALTGIPVSDSYATGAVHGDKDVGGFAGKLTGAPVATSYATGAVFAHGINGGGFAGKASTNEKFKNDYWDTDTSGYGPDNGVGTIVDATGVTGLTTVELKSGLPSGFDSSIWAQDPSVNHGLPYLIALASSY